MLGQAKAIRIFQGSVSRRKTFPTHSHEQSAGPFRRRKSKGRSPVLPLRSTSLPGPTLTCRGVSFGFREESSSLFLFVVCLVFRRDTFRVYLPWARKQHTRANWCWGAVLYNLVELADFKNDFRRTFRRATENQAVCRIGDLTVFKLLPVPCQLGSVYERGVEDGPWLMVSAVAPTCQEDAFGFMFDGVLNRRLGVGFRICHRPVKPRQVPVPGARQ